MNVIRPVFLATYPPEQCGIATFTKDVATAVDQAAQRAVSSVVAIGRLCSDFSADSRVTHVIDNRNPAAYRQAADVVNRGVCDVVSIQHEFGLYPEAWGRRLFDFVERCEKPLVCTLHTLMTQPESLPRRLLQQLVSRSEAVSVMTRVARKLLITVYGAPAEKIHVIPHGVPERPFLRDPLAKARLGYSGKTLIHTFGLISRGKGLEQMIRAMPAVVKQCPQAIYVIVGATHPQVSLQEGESYRAELELLVDSLGMTDHVRFVNRYLAMPELLLHLSASDVFVTPYPGADQIASGTMAYALATVGAVVSTPFLYAKEVLAEGRGQFAPFGDVDALAAGTLRYLQEEGFRKETRRRAYRYARNMFWSNVGEAHYRLFRHVLKPVERPHHMDTCVARLAAPVLE